MKLKKLLSPLVLICIALSCQAENKIIDLSFIHDQKNITISPKIEFSTSKEIQEAIDNGIRVQLIVKAKLYEPNSWWFDKQISSEIIQLEVSYFVLGKYYVIRNKKTDQRFGNSEYSKLWTQLDKFINIELAKLDSTDPWVKIRIMLDKGSLPTAMQLPVLFDENWDIDTDWFEKKVK